MAFLGADTVHAAHSNLTAFFRHQESLYTGFWSEKEILHMQDVRDIYDILFLVFCGAMIILIILGNKKTLHRSARMCIVLPLLLLLILPFFSYFWTNIFHSALFTNDLWMMTPEDLSYHLFPLSFFTNTLVLIALESSFLSLTVYLITKKQYDIHRIP